MQAREFCFLSDMSAIMVSNMSQSTSHYFGIDIGGTKIRLTRTDRPDKVGETCDIPTPASFAVARHHMEAVLDTWAAEVAPTSIGIASPGPLDTTKGVILNPTNLKWRHAAINGWLRERYNCPITLTHDATAAGVCEARLGAGKSKAYILYVSISTGIGSALILHGEPLPSPHNPEGGRMILDWPDQSYEKLASGTAIRLRYGRIAARIHSRKIWAEITHQIGRGLYDLIVATDPEMVILGGGVSVHFKRFSSLLKAEFARYKPLYPIPTIQQAKFTEHAPLIGAMLLANPPE